MNVIVLKIIALITMTIDHIGYIYSIDILRFIGRISFPLYAFLLVNGFKYTKSRLKYLFNIFIFMLISEIPFNLVFSSSLVDMKHNSIFVTLFIGLILLMLLDYLKKKLFNEKNFINGLLFFSFSFLIIVLFACINEFIYADYGFKGILLIGLLYLIDDFRNKKILYSILLVIVLSILVFGTTYYVYRGVYISFIFILLYNDKKIKMNKVLKYLFYSYFPLHLLVLYLLK